MVRRWTGNGSSTLSSHDIKDSKTIFLTIGPFLGSGL